MPVERVNPKNKEHQEQHSLTISEHIARYEFAKNFCKGKKVADIACGTGYGMEIIGGDVTGYDKDDLCGNIVIDLDKEAWNKQYNVITSFETIEHLENPDFFLQNCQKTCNLLIISTPIGETFGDNPYHKQVWKLDEFKQLLEKYFICDYYHQERENIGKNLYPGFLVSVCKPTL